MAQGKYLEEINQNLKLREGRKEFIFRTPTGRYISKDPSGNYIELYVKNRQSLRIKTFQKDGRVRVNIYETYGYLKGEYYE